MEKDQGNTKTLGGLTVVYFLDKLTERNIPQVVLIDFLKDTGCLELNSTMRYVFFCMCLTHC